MILGENRNRMTFETKIRHLLIILQNLKQIRLQTKRNLRRNKNFDRIVNQKRHKMMKSS